MALILVAAAIAVIETEPLVSDGREALFRFLEVAFGSVFLAEYVGRVWTAVENPRFNARRFPRLAFLTSPAAIVDLVVILPVFLALGGTGTLLLRFFRMLRILRVAKLGRMSNAWKHIAAAVHSRRYELGLTVALAAAAMLASATALYWAEGAAQPDKFGSIPRALWWAAVTLTAAPIGDLPISPRKQHDRTAGLERFDDKKHALVTAEEPLYM